MSGGYELGPEGIEHLAGTLRRGGAGLDGVAVSAPEPPDAGDLTGELAAVFAWFTDSAARLSEGTAAAGDTVASNQAVYDETERDASTSFSARAE